MERFLKTYPRNLKQLKDSSIVCPKCFKWIKVSEGLWVAFDGKRYSLSDCDYCIKPIITAYGTLINLHKEELRKLKSAQKGLRLLREEIIKKEMEQKGFD